MKEYRLPKEFTEKWIAALRSGEYKQGEGLLLNDVGFEQKEVAEDAECEFCCLGIACLITGSEKITLCGAEWIQEEIKPNTPIELMGTMSENKLVKVLSKMNDGDGCDKKTFPEIADWITANVELY